MISREYFRLGFHLDAIKKEACCSPLFSVKSVLSLLHWQISRDAADVTETSHIAHALKKALKEHKQRKLTRSQKNYIGWLQHWECKHCMELLPPMFEIDHISPWRATRDDSLDNLQALCANCHNLKTIQARISSHPVFRGLSQSAAARHSCTPEQHSAFAGLGVKGQCDLQILAGANADMFEEYEYAAEPCG